MIDYSIALSKVPNQRFTTNVNGHTFEFSFRTFRGLIYANVTIDGVMYHAGAMCIPNDSLFNSEVNHVANGIFRFDCIEDEYPKYNNFDGTTCKFVYIPFLEL